MPPRQMGHQRTFILSLTLLNWQSLTSYLQFPSEIVDAAANPRLPARLENWTRSFKSLI